jgi:hypothetical protein
MRPTQPTASTARPADSDSSVSTSAPCSTDRWARSCVRAASARSLGDASSSMRGRPPSWASA